MTEDDFNAFCSGKTFRNVLENVGMANYDGKPLSENTVYALHLMTGLKIFIIKSNRRTFKRALKMMMACHNNGMTTPALVADAKLAYDWGLTLVEPISLKEATPDELEGAYVLMEGHGRLHGWLVDLAISNKLKVGYQPFDFHFIYKPYDSPEAFGKAYTSTNADMTRTTNKDRLAIAADRRVNPHLTEYFRKCREDKVISKASYFWTYGRELTAREVTKITYDEPDAPVFDKDTTEALQMIYDSFKRTFGDVGAQKIYRGVSAAQWAAENVRNAEDKSTLALIIDEKLNTIQKDVYTAIITASTNSKKKVNRDAIIKSNLDKMMA